MKPKQIRDDRAKRSAQIWWKLLVTGEVATIKELVYRINEDGGKTAVGNPWTPSSLHSFLNRVLKYDMGDLKKQQRAYILELRKKVGDSE